MKLAIGLLLLGFVGIALGKYDSTEDSHTDSDLENDNGNGGTVPDPRNVFVYDYTKNNLANSISPGGFPPGNPGVPPMVNPGIPSMVNPGVSPMVNPGGFPAGNLGGLPVGNPGVIPTMGAPAGLPWNYPDYYDY